MSGRLLGDRDKGGLYLQEVGSRMVSTISKWCDALNGSASLRDALIELSTGLGAEASVIVRTKLSDQNPVSIASCDLSTDAVKLYPLRRSYADSYFGEPILSARAATIWLATSHEDDATGDPVLTEWQTARRMSEFVVLVLASGNSTRDHIELHFRTALSREMETVLKVMLPEMVRSWSNRKSGLVTRAIVNRKINEPAIFRNPARVRILSYENPSQLSRAEFRVCLLLSRGAMIQAVANELVLSEATIRTHLRNIYAKTGSSSLAELVFRLLDNPTSYHAPMASIA